MRVLLLIIFALMISVCANACKCIPLPINDEIKLSSHIFHGRIILVENNQFEIEVIQIWKGNIKGKVFSLTQGMTSCEKRTFELKKEYLFYVRNKSVDNCSRTIEFDFTTDIQQLDLKFSRKRKVGS